MDTAKAKEALQGLIDTTDIIQGIVETKEKLEKVARDHNLPLTTISPEHQDSNETLAQYIFRVLTKRIIQAITE